MSRMFEASGNGVRTAHVDTTIGEGMKQNAVYVGKTAVPRPLPADLNRKREIIERHLNPVFVVVGRGGTYQIAHSRYIAFPSIRPKAIGTALYYLVAPLVGVAIATGRRPTAVVCQSPYEAYLATLFARLVPRAVRPGVVVEVHGDPGTATRLYGSRSRLALSAVADRIAASSIRRADRVRVIGAYTRDLVTDTGYRGEMDEHIAFSDFTTFLDTSPEPIPDNPCVVFVGMLERHKAPDVLIRAWARVVETQPRATLILVGTGSRQNEIERQVRSAGLLDSVRFVGRVDRVEVPRLMDAGWCLVLPSRSEGLGLVVLEAMCRGRPVIGSRVGGIPELVSHEKTGLLVPTGDSEELADAILSLLSDRTRVEAMGRLARKVAEERDPVREFEQGTRRLAEWVRHAGWR